MDSHVIIRMLTDDGWFAVETHGSHHQFKHPVKAGRVTVPHPCKNVPKGTMHSIMKQAGLNKAV